MILSGRLVTLGGGLVRKHRATTQNTRSHREKKIHFENISNTLANIARTITTRFFPQNVKI